MNIVNSQIAICGVTLSNRLVMPPMATPKSADDGLATDELCQYYQEKSRGGCIGLVITEHSYVDIAGKAHKGQLSIAEDAAIAGLSRLTEAIHRNNTPVFAQLSHAGGRAPFDATGRVPIAPSAVELPRSKPGSVVPREMTLEEIAALVAAFAQAARRAKQAGYNGVEIHCAHSYLLNQFLSPLSNKRQDKYRGDTLEGRTRLHLEIIAAIRETVGTRYPIAMRLAASDFIPGGITLEDAVQASQLFEAAGLNMLDISGGFGGYQRPGRTEPGYFSDLSAAVREAVSIPVMLTGGVHNAFEAERLLALGSADLIGIGRALLANLPERLWQREGCESV